MTKQLLRTYRVTTEANQLKGLEAATLLTVHDQHNICWADVQISRDEFDSTRAYHKAVEDKRHAMKDAWPDEYWTASEAEDDASELSPKDLATAMASIGVKGDAQ